MKFALDECTMDNRQHPVKTCNGMGALLEFPSQAGDFRANTEMLEAHSWHNASEDLKDKNRCSQEIPSW